MRKCRTCGVDISTKPNPLAAVLTNHIPDGFQLEVRHDDEWSLTTYRYTRIADGVWCQHVMSDVVIDHAINSMESIADGVLTQIAEKFAEFDGLVARDKCRYD